MIINESIEVLNQRLVDHFSTAWNGQPMFRIVWSENQFEKRLVGFTDGGIQLLVPEMREVPKYKQWIHNKHILERLVIVPEFQQDKLVEKTSYEPVWVFEDKNGFPLPPKWEATKF